MNWKKRLSWKKCESSTLIKIGDIVKLNKNYPDSWTEGNVGKTFEVVGRVNKHIRIKVLKDDYNSNGAQTDSLYEICGAEYGDFLIK